MKLVVFTSTRADYGILRPLLKRLENDGVDLGLLVSGTHLSPLHGSTVTEIERDGFPIVSRVPIFDSARAGAGWVDNVNALAAGVNGYASFLEQCEPNWALVLGDRFEAFAFASVCHLANLPLAHLHGGEVTAGAVDDAFRHGITKMSSLHLVASDDFGRRVVQLGEAPSSVHVVGALGLDAIRLVLDGRPPSAGAGLLVTYHPATLGNEDPSSAMRAVLDGCRASELGPITVTLPNADFGGELVRHVVAEYEHNGFVESVESFGSQGYIEAVYNAAVVVGNSSSGIIEAPFIGTPTVNVGVRQDGRPWAASVVDSAPTATDIEAAIRSAVSLRCRPLQTTVYGDGGAAERCSSLLREALRKGAPAKRFHDLETP